MTGFLWRIIIIGEKQYDKMVNKIAAIEDKILEIKTFIKVLSIWTKEDYYELIPLINVLQGKIDETVKIIGR